MSSHVRSEQPAAAAIPADELGVVADPVERRPEPRQPCGDPDDPRAPGLAERPRDPRPEPDARPLPASWSSPARRTSIVAHAAGPQAGDHVEPMAPVGDRHRIEDIELGGG